MQVKELIEELQKQPLDAEVQISAENSRKDEGTVAWKNGKVEETNKGLVSLIFEY